MLVPLRAQAAYRVGRLTQDDYDEGRVFPDHAAVAAVEACLEQRHVCLVVAPQQRGKTMLAKMVGLKFLRIYSPATVLYAGIPTLDTEAALAEIQQTSTFDPDRFLFIVDDCHLRVDSALQLIEGVGGLDLGPTRVLLTTREVGTHILQNGDNPASDLDELDQTVRLAPGRDFVARLVRGTLTAATEETVERAVSRLMSANATSADLRLVANTLNYALTTGRAVDTISDQEVLANFVTQRLASPVSRKVLLRIAAIGQFDTGVAALFAETPDAGACDALVQAGLLRRGVDPPTPGLYYWLDDTTEAETYLRAAESHGLLGVPSQGEFVARCLAEYLSGRPANFSVVLRGAETDFGREFIAALLRRDGVSDALSATAAWAPLSNVAETLTIARRADEGLARDFLARFRTEVSDDALITRMRGASSVELLSFLTRASRSGDISALAQRLTVNEVTTKIVAGLGATPVRLLEVFHRLAPATYLTLLESNAITVEMIADALRGMSLQTTMWTLRELHRTTRPKEQTVERQVASLSAGSVLNALGETWILERIHTASLSIVGGVLSLLQKINPATYQTVLSHINFQALAERARRDNCSALHRLMPSLPLPHRARVLGPIPIEAWHEIFGRSSLSSVANFFENLAYHPLDDLGPSIARAFAAADIAKQLRASRVGVAGRLLKNIEPLSREAAGQLVTQMARLSADDLDRLTLAELPELRLERLSLLLHHARTLHPESLPTLVEKTARHPLPGMVVQGPIKSVQIFLYQLLSVNAQVASAWLRQIAPSTLETRVTAEQDLTEVMWLLWNVRQIGPTALGESLLRLTLSRPDFPEGLAKCRLDTRLAYSGLGTFIGSHLETSASVSEITAAISGARSPAITFLALLGAREALPPTSFTDVLAGLDLATVAQNLERLTPYLADSLAMTQQQMLRELRGVAQ